MERLPLHSDLIDSVIGLQKSLSLDKRKAPIDSKRGSITSVRSMRDGRLATPNKVRASHICRF